MKKPTGARVSVVQEGRKEVWEQEAWSVGDVVGMRIEDEFEGKRRIIYW